MKKIKLLFILPLLALFTSCDGDDSSRFPSPANVNTLEGTLTASRDASFSGDVFNFNFTLPQSFSTETQVEVTAVTTTASNSRVLVTVPAGATTGEGQIIMPSSPVISQNYDGTAEAATIQLTGINDGTGAFGLTSNAVTLNYYDFTFTNNDGLSLGLDWEGDASVDIDMVLFTSAGQGTALAGATLAKPESDSVDSEDLADGDYVLLYRSYSDVTTPIQLRVVGKAETSFVEVFTYDFPSLPVSGGWSFANLLLEVNKSTDEDGNVTYTFTQPE